MPSKPAAKPHKSGVNQHKGYLVRAPDAVRALWREAAEDEGSPLSEWARELLTVQAALQLKMDPSVALEMLREEPE